MHLVYLGFTRDLCGLLNGTSFKESRMDLDGVTMSADGWKAIGIDMENIEAPVSWGRYL
jgi:hypothetical protein